MQPSKNDDVQETEPLDLDVVADLERIINLLGLDVGQVTMEAVFAHGSFMRGFIKRGPLTAQETRELATAATGGAQ